ncbi:MAG TPA: Ig-like domain-containing protein, partial [Spirochaetota bacterium]|nr:Ig-like domain-containing protein [Spirochaetota bacterium]
MSCGKSIENAQDFIPNDPPVIESCTVTDDATGKEIDASNIILGMKLKCAVKASDPEGKPLAYTFTSDYLSCSSQTGTADGCDGIFVVTKVVANTPVTLTVSVRDQKDASATMLIPIGTGKEGPLLTVGSPDKTSINSTGYATFVFTCTSDGIYQVLESGDDVSKNPAAYLKTTSVYTAGEEIKAIVGGPSYSVATADVAKTAIVSSGDGPKKIWIVFKDNNNYYAASSVSVSLDSVSPTIVSTTPANGATNVSTSPTLSIVFSEDMDTDTLSLSLTPAGGTVSNVDFNTTTHAARYNVKGLSKNTTYTAIVSNAKDVVGNTVSAKISFTTTPTNAVTYDGNGSDSGQPPLPASCDVGQTVTVLGNTGKLTKSGFEFVNWNTEANGGGASYGAGSTFTMPPADVTLYAIWKQVSDTTVTLNASRICLDVNSSSQLVKTLLPIGTPNANVSWSSSNTSVATITSGGYVTAVAAGSSVITCTASGGDKATCLVTVMAPVTVTTFVTGFVNPADLTSDGTSLYVADCYNYSIKTVVIATKEVSKLIGGASGNQISGIDNIFTKIQGITWDGYYLYATDATNARVMKIPKNGASSSVLVSGLKGPRQIVCDKSNLLLLLFADCAGSYGVDNSFDIKAITTAGTFLKEAE